MSRDRANDRHRHRHRHRRRRRRRSRNIRLHKFGRPGNRAKRLRRVCETRSRYPCLIAFVLFTLTKLMLVVVPSMSTSTVLAVSSWSWLRFSPAIFTNDSPTTVELITVYLYIYMYGVPPRLGWRSRCVCRRRCVPVGSRRTNSPLAVRQCVLAGVAGVCVRTLANPPPLAARALVYPVTKSVPTNLGCPDFRRNSSTLDLAEYKAPAISKRRFQRRLEKTENISLKILATIFIYLRFIRRVTIPLNRINILLHFMIPTRVFNLLTSSFLYCFILVECLFVGEN